MASDETFKDDDYQPKADRRDSETMSVASVTTKSSTSSKLSSGSVLSKMSRASSSMASALKRGLSAVGPRSSTRSVSEMVDLAPGDVCETIALVTVREDECLDSGVVMELQVGTTLDVLEIGQGRRIKIGIDTKEDGRKEGWISSKTKINEALVMKCSPEIKFATMDFEMGGMHEVKAMVTVRKAEELDSQFVTELKPGTTVRILECGVNNKRRVKVGSEWHTGWISTATKSGELLIGKVEERGLSSRGMPFSTTSGAKVKQLLEAARSGNEEQIKKLVESKESVVGRFVSRPNLNSSDVRGKTALIYAAAFGKKAVVEYLLSKREVDVNALDDTQKTALHHASKRTKRPDDLPGSEFTQGEILTMLLNAGAYMEARDHNGCTALMFAVANGDMICTRNLLTAQANVNVKDFEGHRPLDYATMFKQDEVVKLLKAEGAIGMGGEEEHPDERQDEDEADEGEAQMDQMDQEQEAEAEGAGVEDGSNSVFVSEAAAAASASTSAAPAATKKKSSKKKSVALPDGAEPPVGEKLTGTKSTEGKPAGKKKSTKSSGSAEGGKKGEKGEKGEKPKAKAKKKAGEKKQNAVSLAMMEAIGRDDATVEVTVEETPKEDVDLKVRALAKMKAVVETAASPGEVEAAIKVAQAEGATDEEVAEAQQVLQKLKDKFYAEESLREAVKSGDVGDLKDAIKKAEALGLSGPDMDAARAMLEKEGPKQKAREDLQSAKAEGNIEKMKEAVKAAKKAGLSASELGSYEQILSDAESKDKVEAALSKAIESREVSALKLSIQQAKDMGLDSPKVAEATKVLEDEEPKQKAREQLEQALETCTKDALRAAIDGAKKAGLTAAEYKEAEAALDREEKKEKLLAGVNAALEETKTVDMTDIDALKAAKDNLTTKIQEAVANGVAESDVSPAEIRRKKLHNAIEDLKGSIRVFCRVRPISKREIDLGDGEITKQVDSMTLQVSKDHQFKFDAVFTPGTQDEIFEDCKDLVQSAIDGYNVTLFAYGQTGAGKTFTMSGVPGQLGVSPRTIKEIYEVCEKSKDRFEYTIMGSMLELYKMDLVDLLTKGNSAATKNKLQIRQDKTGMVSIEHLTEEECATADQLEKLVERGVKARSVAATQMNSESSRSHLVLLIRIISVNKETKEQLKGKVLIVDLAGSERLKKSQTEADMQKESIEINKSLTALGDVIEALTKNQKVIPYRNHKLTQLMQDALGGSAKTLMFVNCSPASSNCEETLNSLKYAQRAKNITNTIKKT